MGRTNFTTPADLFRFARARVAALCIIAGCGVALSACSPCESLEESLCEDLGENCDLWRESGRPGLPDGRRAFRQCVNASFGSQYDLTLKAATASVEALAKARAAQ